MNLPEKSADFAFPAVEVARLLDRVALANADAGHDLEGAGRRPPGHSPGFSSPDARDSLYIFWNLVLADFGRRYPTNKARANTMALSEVSEASRKPPKRGLRLCTDEVI